MNLIELQEELEKLNKQELKIVIFRLLISKKLNYVDLSRIYVNYLERIDELNIKSKSLFANCLGAYIQGFAEDNKDFFESQAYVLLRNCVDERFFEKYLKNRKDELIKKNEEMLK
jgi:hypothetical protein